MRKFRAMLALLLCLTVPVAGSASVLGGLLCPQRHQQHAPEGEAHDQAVAYQVALPTVSGSEHRYEQGAGTTSHGKSCRGGHCACACGCGVGACSLSALSLSAPLLASFAIYAGKLAVPPANEPSYASARDSSPLRPPIS